MISDEMTKAEAAEAPASASIAPADAGKAAEAQQAEAPKKRVGRPRKKTEADEKPASEEGQAEKPSSSRKASASFRVSAKEASTSAGEASDSANEPAAAKRATRASRKKAASDEEAENAAPRKRTRRTTGEPTEASSTDTVSEKPRQEMIQFDSDAPSTKSDNNSSRAEDAAENSQEASSKPATRKRPGRSTKLRMAIEAAESADEADGKTSGDAETSQESSDGEKPARRRSVRARKTKAAPDQHEGAEESASRDDVESVEGRQKDDGSEHRGDVEKSASEASEDSQNREKQDRRERDYRSQRNQQRQNQRERRQNKQNGQQNRDRGNDRRDRDRDRDQHRRQRRTHSQNREPVAPKTNMEELAKLKVAELREKAAELGLDATGLKKAELVEKVYEAAVRAEGFIEVEGILDVLQDGYGFLRTKGYLPSENDVYVGLATIRRNGLRKGDLVKGQTRPARENEKYAALQQVLVVNGIPVDEQGERVRFGDLTPVFPDECLIMEHGKNTITARVIDLVSPIGKGQRGLIVSPPKAGKTTVLKDIAAAITANNPEVHLMCLLVDERPEEVTDMQRSIKGEVIASTFDMPTENHIAVSELVIERAKRLVERGEDVVVLLDSLTRLARAYNLAQPASGRILSGGVDSTALYPPKRFLGAARNIEGGGSLTILASALIETGSKMDEVIFE